MAEKERREEHKSRSRLLKATFLVMQATALSRVIGYVREVVVAAYFGTGYQVDAYRVAIQLPNLFRLLIGDAVIAAAFVPIFSSYLAKKDEETAWQIASRILTITFLLLSIITFFGEVFAPYLINLLAPGFFSRKETFELSVQLTRIMFPSLVFMALSGLFSGMLNSYEIFLLPAISPVIWNLIIISGIVFFSKNYGIFAFAVGLLIASIVQALIQLPGFSSKIKLYRPIIDFSHPEVRNFMTILIPIVLSAATSNINTIIDTRFASYLKTGVVAALGYAIRIYLVPAGVFGVAVATVLFPRLSQLETLAEEEKFLSSFSYGLRLLTYIIVPVSTFFVVFALPIVRILFERGEFAYSDSLLTAAPLSMYSLGVVAYSLNTLISRAYYSKKDSKTPMLIALASIVINYFGDWALMRLMPLIPQRITLLKPVSWLFAPHAGIALSTSIVSIFQLFLLIYFYRKLHGRFEGRRFISTLLKSLLGSALAAASGYAVYNLIAGGTALSILTGLLAAFLAGLLIYIAASYVFRMEEIKLAEDLIRARLKRS